jgi:hypothetical protein
MVSLVKLSMVPKFTVEIGDGVEATELQFPEIVDIFGDCPQYLRPTFLIGERA